MSSTAQIDDRIADFARLVTRLTDDAGDKISWFLCSGVFRTYEATLIVLACVVAMASIDWQLTLWILMPLPVLLGLQALAQDALGKRFLAVQQAISGINDELTSTFGGIRIVQACRLVAQARSRFAGQIERQEHAEVQTQRVQQGVLLLYGYGWQIALVALLLAGGLHVLGGELTLGEFITFEGLVNVLVWPMFDVGMFLSRYKQTATALTLYCSNASMAWERSFECKGSTTLPLRSILSRIGILRNRGTRGRGV